MKYVLIMATALALLLALGGCKQGGGYGETPPTPAATGTTAPMTTNVKATLADFTITMDPATVPAGSVHFDITNAGKAHHALEIKGDGVDSTSATLSSGQTTTLDVTGLKTGSYRVWCPVGNHADRGMDTKLTVTEATPTK